jgi:hypothetical protein
MARGRAEDDEVAAAAGRVGAAHHWKDKAPEQVHRAKAELARAQAAAFTKKAKDAEDEARRAEALARRIELRRELEQVEAIVAGAEGEARAG